MLDLDCAIVLASACERNSSQFGRVLQGLRFIVLQPLQLLGSTSRPIPRMLLEDLRDMVVPPMLRVEIFSLQSRLKRDSLGNGVL